MADLPSSDAKNICSDAVDVLLQYIYDHRLKAGSPLPSAEVFCREHDFSRMAFREALSYLKGLGILSAGRGRNIQVADVDPIRIFSKLLPVFFAVSSNLEEITALRIANEIGIFPSVVDRALPADIQELEQVIADTEALLRQPDGCTEDFYRLDGRFHQILCRISSNRLAILISRYSQWFFFDGDADKPVINSEIRAVFKTTNQGHRTILDAIKIKNVEIGTLAMIDHLWKTYRGAVPSRPDSLS